MIFGNIIPAFLDCKVLIVSYNPGVLLKGFVHLIVEECVILVATVQVYIERYC